MGKLFKKKTVDAIKMAHPPVTAETPGEIKHIQELSQGEVQPQIQQQVQAQPQPEVQYQEVPVFLSQAQINNMIIENNVMLKQIMADIE